MPGAGPTRVAFVSLQVSFALHESRVRREGARANPHCAARGDHACAKLPGASGYVIRLGLFRAFGTVVEVERDNAEHDVRSRMF